MVKYLKKIFRTEKIRKKIMTSFIVVIVLMSIGTTLGAITLFYTTRQYNAALENYGFSQGDIGKAMISFADMRSATRAGIGEDDTELIEASVKEHDAQAEECSKNMKLIKECLSSKEEKAIYEKIETTMREYYTIEAEVLELGTTKDLSKSVQAQKMAAEKLDPAYDQVYDNMKDLLDLKEKEGNALKSLLLKAINIAVIILIVVLIISISISNVLARTVSNAIATPLQELAERLKAFAKGDILELDEDGRIEQNGYEGVAKKNIYGFYTALLIPTYEYQSEIYQWTLLTGSVIFISLAILAVVAISQIWLVSHPIKVLEKEMRHFGKGDFSEAETPVQLAEYNQLFATFNQMKAQIQELIESEQRKEKEKADLELEKLMYQINPHFLMNALNSIHWMALTNHQKEIDDYVKHLGFILSYSLGKAEQNTTLRTELKYLQYYLELQQMTHDFSSEFDIAEGEYLNTRCARFLLQPIAENAVCHNMDEFGTLWVEASEQDGIITIRIRDDGKGFEISEKMEQNAKDERKGIGLRYVQMTLKSFYGEEEMKIESELGKGTEVTLHFPVLPA